MRSFFIVFLVSGCAKSMNVQPMTDVTADVVEINAPPSALGVPHCDGRLVGDQCVPNDTEYCDEFEIVGTAATVELLLFCYLPNQSVRGPRPDTIPAQFCGETLMCFEIPLNTVSAPFKRVTLNLTDGTTEIIR